MSNLMKHGIFICISILVLCSFVSAQKFGKVQDSEWLVTAPEDYPEAGAIVLFDKQQVEVSIRNVKIERHIRMKVLTASGIDDVGDQSVTYNENYGKLKNFEAQTITPDGKKQKVEKDAIFEKTYNNFITQSFSFPNVSEGVILEYKYTIISEYLDIPTWYFQQDLYTLKSEITISLGAGFAFNMLYNKVYGEGRNPDIKKRPDPNYTVGTRSIKDFTWKLENLPPIKKEPFMSSVNDYRASLQFLLLSYTYPDGSVYPIIKNWQDQADGLEVWFDGYCNKDGDIKNLAKEITAGLTDTHEKSLAIFNYIKENYKSTDDYINRFFSHEKISDLLKEKAGTPEEKNLFLVQLHKAAGIDCWPVLISTRSHGQFEPKYPEDRQFNYLISFVQIGDSWEFLDVADRNTIYGVLQPQCLADGGFLIDGKNSQLVKMTIKPFNSSRNDLTTMFINAEGQAACTTLSTFTGYYAAEKLDDYDNSTQKEFIEEFINDKVEKAITLGSYTCVADSANNFVVSGTFSTNELVRQLDENLIVKPVSLAFVENPFKSDKRFFDIDFTYPFVYQNTVRINFEKTPKEIHLPDDVLNDLGNLRLIRTSTLDGSTVVLTHTLEILVPKYNKGKYPSMKALFEQLSLLDDDEISLVYEETE